MQLGDRMSVFDVINARISENLQRHGHYLTDPRAADEEKITETVDILTQFVRPERRETVRSAPASGRRRFGWATTLVMALAVIAMPVTSF
jgi:hypothetical protein